MNRRRFLATASTGIGAATWFEPFAPAQTVGSVEGLELDNIYPKAEDGATSTAIFYRAKGTNPKAAIILMHPRADFTRWQLSGYLGKSGIGMLGCASRYINNDTDCLTENVLLDIAAGIQQIKERYGIQRVIGYGHSGGGSLYSFYQGQAMIPPGGRLTAGPSGDGPDLNKFNLPQLDGIIISNAHKGEGKVCMSWIDPSVVDESDPFATDPALDMYDERNGYRPPPASSKYSTEFLMRFRAAQAERTHRLDTKAKSMIEQQRRAQAQMRSAGFASLDPAEQRRIRRLASVEQTMVIYRTAAEPKYTDLSIDPSDRLVHANPERANYGRTGLARTMTARGWLSTWSGLSSNMVRDENLAKITIPTLVIGGTCDISVSGMQYLKDAYDASAAKDKSMVWIKGGDHNFVPVEPIAGKRNTVDEAGNAVVKWVHERFPA